MIGHVKEEGARGRLLLRRFGQAASVPTTARLSGAPGSQPSAIVADFGTVLNGTASMRAASVRGLSHQFDGSPRQDSYAVIDTGEVLAVAVADGVGSAALSHVGSRIAVDTAVGLLSTGGDVTSVGAAVRAAIIAEAARCGQRPAEMATTLTVARIRRSGERWPVRVAEWGDSRATCLRAGSGQWSPVASALLVSAPDGSVAALPVHGTPTAVGRSTLDGGDVLLLASDGVDAHLWEGSLVAEGLAAAWAEQPSVFQFIADVGFERAGARDDRTAVAVFRPARESGGV